MATAYIEERQRAGMKPRTIQDYQKDLQRSLGSIAGKPINQIDRAAIVSLHETLSEKGPTSVNRVMRFARAVFNFAIENDDYKEGENYLLLSNPVTVLAKRHLWNPSKRRHSYLDSETLGPWLKAVLSLDPLRWCEKKETASAVPMRSNCTL